MDFIGENLSDNIYRFSHNKYVCLKCRKEIEISELEWQRFENLNIVLKNPNNMNIEYYHNLYYQLLYQNYSFENAQEHIISVFNKNKTLINKEI